MGMLSIFLAKIYTEAVYLNHRNIYSILSRDHRNTLIDLGCDDGELSIRFGKESNCHEVHGVEIMDDAKALAASRGMVMHAFDLNGAFDLPDHSFDIVCANQVIEHLCNSDMFLSEIFRILVPGGYAIISTENASSWCNIFASIMGWQIFSLTNFSSLKPGIGNPLAIHKNSRIISESWNHVRIYNYKGLIDYFGASGFNVEQIAGAGYFPFPAEIGRLDKMHSHFLTVKVRKPEHRRDIQHAVSEL